MSGDGRKYILGGLGRVYNYIGRRGWWRYMFLTFSIGECEWVEVDRGIFWVSGGEWIFFWVEVAGNTFWVGGSVWMYSLDGLV